MVGMKNRSGGKREGAGRPKAKAPMLNQPRSLSDKPIFKGGDKPTSVLKLDFKDLARKPGITVLDTAIHVPATQRVIKYGDKWVAEAGPLFRGAKTTYSPWSITDPDAATYDYMHKFYREYRRDSLVRACINALAYYSTSKGFQTQLEPTNKLGEEGAAEFIKPYEHVKNAIDEKNK